LFGWNREVTIAGLAANGTYEDQVGKAPKIVYNQHIEDFLQVQTMLATRSILFLHVLSMPRYFTLFLVCWGERVSLLFLNGYCLISSLLDQGFCDSQWMKGYSDYIGDG
jgi:hypothetical protein